MTQIILWITVKKLIEVIRKYMDKKKRSKLELENELLDFALLNLSGRPLDKEVIEEVKRWGKCKIIKGENPNVDLSNPINYMDNNIDFCATVLNELIKKEGLLNILLLGKYIIIPPGMISTAMTFTTMFHGITGRFPDMSFFYEKGRIYNLIRSYNFQKLRNQYREIQKSEKAIEKVQQEFVLINLSHHPLAPEALSEVKRWGDYKIINRVIPNIDLKNPLTYMDNVINFCSETLKDLIENEGILDHLKLGKYVIIPSGMASVTLTFVSMFHGISGHFPRMSFFYKRDIGFDLTKPFDFYELRTQFRDIPK